MRIQNIVFPKEKYIVEECEEMYVRKIKGDKKNYDNGLCLFCGEKYDFSTYFNGFSIGKWKKYTNIEQVSLCLLIKGHCRISLVQNILGETGVDTICLDTYEIDTQEAKRETFEYKNPRIEGILGFQVECLGEQAWINEGGYETNFPEEQTQKVDIAINICTYRREQYILENIEILKEAILENSTSPLYGHLQVFVADNGKSLPYEELNTEYLHIFPNRNVGGAGGFTRGLIEILHAQGQKQNTHILMMDDDVVIEPEALFRTYMLLKCRKQEYRDAFVGGAMLKLDEPYMQVEAGALWNGGKIISNKKQYDMRELTLCLDNEQEVNADYHAWWYCCIPMSKISKDNLPLPIFIRGDDVEYGLRNMKDLILLNGICVWHESFENKYSSFLQYYIIRNMLYDNALHCDRYGLSRFLVKLCATVARELVFYRYKNIDLIFKGVEDFYKGVAFLEHTDGEKLHQTIMEIGYRPTPMDRPEDYSDKLEHDKTKLTGKEKVKACLLLAGFFLPAKGKEWKTVSMARCRVQDFFRQKNIINYDAVSGKAFMTQKSVRKTFGYLGKLLGITVQSIFIYNKKRKQFKQEASKVMTEVFWKEYLEI